MNRSTDIIYTFFVFFVISISILFPCVVAANDDGPVVVNVDNFVRAETAAQFDRVLKLTGGINQWLHVRQPQPLDQQNVIRMNRDTLYSSAIVDISKGPHSPCPTLEIAISQ